MSIKNSGYFRPPNQKGTTANAIEDREAAMNQLPPQKSKYIYWWDSLTHDQRMFIMNHPEVTNSTDDYYIQWHTMEGWPK